MSETIFEGVPPKDPERINPFLEEIGKIWKQSKSDMRFGQFITNVFKPGEDIFYYEDDILLEKIKEFYEVT